MGTTWEHGGYCACGCGQKTSIAPSNWPAQDMRKGEPYEYVWQHHNNKRRKGYVVDPETGCRVFQGQKSQKYPSIKVDGKQVKAHIYFWEQAYGSVPKGLVLHHTCGNTRCVNLEHLEAVTAAVNVQAGGSAKLSMDKADAIRRMAAEGKPYRVIAEMYGVSLSTIQNVIYGHTWKPIGYHRPQRPVRRIEERPPLLGGDDTT